MLTCQIALLHPFLYDVPLASTINLHDFVISLCCTAILISLPAIAALSSLLFLKFYHIPQTLTFLVGCCRVRGPNPPVNSLSPLPVLSAWQGLEPQSTLYTQVWLPLDIRDDIKIVQSNIIR